MEEYKSEARDEADRFLEEVDRHIEEARLNDQRADRYILLTVIFASVLFFGGMSTEFKSLKIRIGLVAFSSLTFLITLVIVITFPIL